MINQLVASNYSLNGAAQAMSLLNEKVFADNKIEIHSTEQSKTYANMFIVYGRIKVKNGYPVTTRPDAKPDNMTITEMSYRTGNRKEHTSPSLHIQIYWRIGFVGSENYYDHLPYIIDVRCSI